MQTDRMELLVGEGREPGRGKPKPLPRMRRRLAERGLDRRVDRKEIPYEEGRPVEQSPQTTTGPNDSGERHEVEFATYTPLGTPTNSGPIPPDPSGADGADGIVLYTGNTYLMASTDGGNTFTEHDSTAFLPAAQGRPVDQVMIYVTHRRLFAWMMQYGVTPATGEGNFRLAIAHAAGLIHDVESAWTVYDFTSTDLGAPGVATDRQDLAFNESRLYMTTNLVGKGRVVMSLSLDDLDAGRTVSWTRTDPLDGMFQFSDLSQQNNVNVHSVAIASNTRLRVMRFDDGAGNYNFHDVAVGQFPVAADLKSLDPDGVDWLTRGVANVSAALVDGNSLWVAWDAAASAAGEHPVYPNAHVRLSRIDMLKWTTVEEHQVWNPAYAFAYGCLAAGKNGEIAYGVGVGGPNDYPNSCFGILGDFVVYFRDGSSATPGADSEPRWGDYITVRPSSSEAQRFSAFGYYVKRQGSNAIQRPFYLSYGRP
jgi:hypothetical protein